MASTDKDRKKTADQTAKKVTYKTSSFCNYGECVGIARMENGDVIVKNTKNASERPLNFTQEEWKAFVAGVKNGEFEIENL